MVAYRSGKVFTSMSVPTSGTIGQFSNNSSMASNCKLILNHPRDLPSFDTAAVASRVTSVTILAVLIPPTIFLNITILIAIIKNRTLWRSSNILIGFLAVTDALVGMVSMPLLFTTVLMEILYERSTFDRQAYCVISKAALNAGDLGMGWSFITIVLITLERYVAIFAPFWYRKYFRTSIMVKITVLIWIVWLGLVVILVLNLPENFAFGVVILVLVVIVYFLAVPAFIRIYHLLTKLETSQIPETNTRPTIDRKGSITCAIMLLGLVVCYTPLIVVSVVLVFKGLSKYLLTYFLPWGRLILLANSLLNPIIYISRNPLIQRSVKNIFKHFYKNANSRPVTNTAVPEAPAAKGISNEAACISQL